MNPSQFATPSERHEHQQIIKIYLYYRLLLAALLCLGAVGILGIRFLGNYHPVLYLDCSVIYLLLTLGQIGLNFKYPLEREATTFFVIFSDITIITILMHASGGISSGLGTLFIICVAAGGLLFKGRVSTLVAALSTLAALTLVLSHQASAREFLQAGTLGAIYFATSFFIQHISRRVRRVQNIANAQAQDINVLERLNHLIIQRMRTGILVVTHQAEIRFMNQAAQQLLKLPMEFTALPLTDLHTVLPEIATTLQNWKQNPHQVNHVQDLKQAGLRLSFASLQPNDQPDTVIFIEDTIYLSRQAQQMKLGSLGRLAASIAHEIRNPLGAISHAAQLLHESDQLQSHDQRLVEIILQHSQNMDRIINNVLELSRRKAPNWCSFDLGNWLSQFVADFKQSFGDELEFELTLPPQPTIVQVDPMDLTQVLTNLCENGIRYSQSYSHRAYISLQAGIDQVDQLPFIKVIDKGKGIETEALDQIFEPFYTTENTGTGLGLYISKELCEANQAHLRYETSIDGGACFAITFAHPDRLTD